MRILLKSIGSNIGRQCIALILLVLVLAGVGCSDSSQGVVKNAWVSELVAAENLILKLTIRLDAFNGSARELSFPSGAAKTMFADSISVADISDNVNVLESYDSLKTQVSEHGVTSSKHVARRELTLWQPLLGALQEMKNARFYFIKGQFAEGDRNEFETLMGFEGLGQLETGEWASIHVDEG